ncbi:MAG: family 20 glycosylhydrolase, partial [Holophagae bacterium]|nr:family 20 glycosylhydrolase [Holophagae bacterium]
KVNKIIFALLDEIIDAFQPDAFHVGMDEVFLIGHEKSPSTKGKDPSVVFAKVVKDFHKHIVKKHKIEMLIWGDRLIDGKKFKMGKWGASENGTWKAADLIPKDVIVCPWHYNVRKKGDFPSIPMLIKKGFRVLPCGYKDVKASEQIIRYAHKYKGKDKKMLGHCFTIWGEAWQKDFQLKNFEALNKGTKLLDQLQK